jgi:outer membrane protein TolC
VVPRRQRILELTKLEHNAMFVGIFQLLQAKQNDLQARRELIEVEREYWSARTDLDRAVQGIASETSFSPATQPGPRPATGRGGH